MAKRWMIFGTAKRLTIIISLFFIITLIVMGVAVAQPPFSQSGTGGGYNIKVQEIGTIKQNQDFNFNFHVFNISNGVPIDNSSTNCALHLYIPNGTQIFESNVSHTDSSTVNNEWEITVLGGNFSNVGDHAYNIQCSSAVLGGFQSVGFEVIYSGQTLTTAQSIVYFSLFFLFIILFAGFSFALKFLPSSNSRDEEGRILSISWMKYLRAPMYFLLWILFIAIIFLASNVAFAYLGETLFAQVLFNIFRICFALTPLIIILWAVYFFIKFFEDRKFQAMLNRGFYPQQRL